MASPNPRFEGRRVIEITVMIREPGRLNPDYSLKFAVPAVPSVGSYISITRPDTPAPWSEDVIVRAIWWQLLHPETNGFADDDDEHVGRTTEVVVECEIAEGPNSSDHWRNTVQAAREKGVDVPVFEIARLSVTQGELRPERKKD